MDNINTNEIITKTTKGSIKEFDKKKRKINITNILFFIYDYKESLISILKYRNSKELRCFYKKHKKFTIKLF